MTLHTKTNDQTATEFHKTFDMLGLTQGHLARLFGVGPRSIRRWQRGDRRIPCGVSIVFRLLAAGTVTIDQVERAAAPVRTNGSGVKLAPPAPVAPAPAQAGTLAEKVLALAPGACRWPSGDPRHPDFCFCAKPVVRGAYCEYHRTRAYMENRERSARIALHQWSCTTSPALFKGTRHVATPVTLSVSPAGASNHR